STTCPPPPRPPRHAPAPAEASWPCALGRAERYDAVVQAPEMTGEVQWPAADGKPSLETGQETGRTWRPRASSARRRLWLLSGRARGQPEMGHLPRTNTLRSRTGWLTNRFPTGASRARMNPATVRSTVSAGGSVVLCRAALAGRGVARRLRRRL